MWNPHNDLIFLFAFFLLELDHRQIAIHWVWGYKTCNFYEDRAHDSFISVSAGQALRLEHDCCCLMRKQ